MKYQMMRYVECKGTPLEIGRQQGEAFRELIRERWEKEVEPMRVRLCRDNATAEFRIAEAHKQMLTYLKRIAPEMTEEMRGLGEGAGLPFDDILWMSTYNSLMFVLADDRFRVESDHVADGCSALAFAKSPVGPFVFKTYDPMGSKEIDSIEKRRKKADEENRWLYVVCAEYSTGFTVLGVRMPGSIWTEGGLNNHGLAFASASLHPRLYPQQACALPQHFLGTLGINRCRTTAEVRELMQRVTVFGKGYAMAWGDTSGDCVGIEKTADCTGLNEPQNGLAFQTNHIRAPELARQGREQDPKFWESRYYANSSNRVSRIEQQLSKWKSSTQFESIVDDLFHAGAQGDLIQNCTEQNQYWITTWGALLFPKTGELWIAEGLPEEKKFRKWKL